MKGRIVMVVENLSAPFDKRVWREAVSLKNNGYQVSIISPRGKKFDVESYSLIDDISIYRFKNYEADSGIVQYIAEYANALIKIFYLLSVLYVRKGFDVIHICNPPDLLFIPTLPFKLLGKKVVFDHHDLSPETFMEKWRDGKLRNIINKTLLMFERLTFYFSDVVIANNHSFHGIAQERGKVDQRKIFVVKNGPRSDSVSNVESNPALKNGKQHLIVYVGTMGEYDGVDILLRVIQRLRYEHGRNDFHVRLMGSGPLLASLKQQASDLKIENTVSFTGVLPYDKVLEGIATADIGICPDPKNALNQNLTFIKIIEYISLGKPAVAFDLPESRLSAGDACLYVTPNNEQEFGEKINYLLNSPDLRKRMGEIGKKHFMDKMAWEHSERNLYDAYAKVFERIRS